MLILRDIQWSKLLKLYTYQKIAWNVLFRKGDIVKGHIAKKGKRYYIVVDIGRDPKTGKRQQKWFSGYRTKKEAQKDLTRILYELEKDALVIPSTDTLKEYLEYWIGQREPNLSPTTIYGYKAIINNHIVPELGNIKLNELKPLHIQEYYKKKLETLSNQTVLHHHRLLRKALQDAMQWQLIKNNPADYMESPKTKRYKAKVLDVDEIKKLLEALEGDRLEVPITLMLFLGLRRGELLALKWSDIDYKNKTITIQRNLVRAGEDGTELIIKDPKTEESIRTIPISDNVLALLKKQELKQKENKLKLGPYYKDSDFVFTTEEGELINPASFSRMFGDFLKKHNLKKIRLHDLRHTNATLMLKSNIPTKIASQRLGHSNVSTTLDLYSHVLKDMERETTEKIDEIIFDSK